MIYLATPYSAPHPVERQARFRRAAWWAGEYLKLGIRVFSPICHSHPIAATNDLPGNYETWRDLDEFFIGISNELHVIQMPGWRESKGIEEEMIFASGLGKPIRYIRDDKSLKPQLIYQGFFKTDCSLNSESPRAKA